MNYRLFNILIIVWLLLSGSHTVIANENITAKLISNNIVDICGNKKSSVIVVIDIGEITKNDSLAGYNFEINYNPEKLKFHTALTTGTLTEGIQVKDYNFADTGKFYGYALKTTNLIEGNKPLIAFLGDYLGNCPDTAYINISFIEFTEYFKKEVDSIENTIVKSEVFIKDDRLLSTDFVIDSIFLPFEENSVSTNALLSSYSDARLDTVDFQISISDTSRFEISGINSLSDNVTLINYDSEKCLLRTKIDGAIKSGDGFYIELNEKTKNDTIVELSINPVKINECSCITYLYGDSQYIKSEIKDTFSNNVEFEILNEINCYYNKLLEEFIIIDKKLEINEITLMSLDGKILERKNVLNKQSEYIIEVNSYVNSIYILQLKNKNAIKNILLIKY